MLKKIIITLSLPIIRLWIATWRFSSQVPNDTPGIMLMWHEELLPILKNAAHKRWVVIISPSKDGNYLVTLLSKWGYTIVRGSASTHSKAVHTLRETIKLAPHNKITLGIDGPRGPRRQIKVGMLLAAQKTGVPIFLVRIKADSGVRLDKAWDKHFIPYPFSKIHILKSAPIYIDKTLTKDELHKLSVQLSSQLNQLSPTLF